ncbi:zinc ribbon domain-containing protein [Butyrivibrio sp. NC3005]|uniref:zinc ribbon domain-containing protein n=1 Tax=Butyrivibrio sp. NC3005 TaxID=1280685 RepID=UPI0004193F97|nr:zinc ribbon domain-containing protein [Butyrivibrio sp. NC3005]
MFCQKCGKAIPEGAMHCIYCGAPVKMVATPNNNPNYNNNFQNNSKQQVYMQNANPYPNSQINGNQAINTPVKPAKKKGKKVLPAMMVLLTMMVAAGGGFSYFYYEKKQNEKFNKYMENGDEFAKEGDFESAQESYSKALKIKKNNAKAKEKKQDCNAKAMLGKSIKQLKSLEDYKATIDYRMQLHVKDSSDNKNYDIDQSSKMNVVNISDVDNEETSALVEGSLVTSSTLEGDNEQSQEYKIITKLNASAKTQYSYTESTGWGAHLSSDEFSKSVIIDDYTSLDYVWDKEESGEYLIFKAEDVAVNKKSFFTKYCKIAEQSTLKSSQKMNVTLFVNPSSGALKKIRLEYPRLNMTGVNAYYCDYSGKNLSITLKSLTYDIVVTDFATDLNVAVPKEAVDSISIGNGIGTSVSFSTEPVAYLGPNTKEDTFNDLKYNIPTTWKKAESGNGEKIYILSNKGTARINLEFAKKNSFPSSDDSRNMKDLVNYIRSQKQIEVSEESEVKIAGKSAVRISITGSIGKSTTTVNGLVYIIPSDKGYTLMTYLIASGTENIWQGQIDSFIGSISTK